MKTQFPRETNLLMSVGYRNHVVAHAKCARVVVSASKMLSVICQVETSPSPVDTLDGVLMQAKADRWGSVSEVQWAQCIR